MNTNAEVPVAKGRRKVCKISIRSNLVHLEVNTFKCIGGVIGVDGIIPVSKPRILESPAEWIIGWSIYKWLLHVGRTEAKRNNLNYFLDWNSYFTLIILWRLSHIIN